MCGFILAPKHFAPKIPAGLDDMSYRGADGFRGISERGGWVLGHVRLAIQTDASFGAQPFDREDSSIAFVGEIFSKGGSRLLFEDSEEDYLREALSSPHLSGFMGLDGFWSIAEITDEGKARVLTDHLGIKPVYYWSKHDIFCSELDPMFVVAGEKPELDETYLSNCIKFGYDYSGRTPYKGVVQMAPGTVGVSHPLKSYPGFEFQPYWNWGKVRIPTSSGWGLEGVLHGLLTQATLDRVSNSVREVGLLLSGGLDSTIIYSILKTSGLLDEVSIFSIENGESEFLPKTDRITMLKASAFPKLEDAIDIMQAPLDLGSLLPQVAMAQALERKGLRVCITGDGADELFGGYRRAQEYDSQGSDVFCELPYYHLPRLDRVHMHFTTEIRSPFLSPKVVAFALRLPRDRRTGKRILKEAFARQVPKEVLEREKLPLKSEAVLSDPLAHRAQLVEIFRNGY